MSDLTQFLIEVNEFANNVAMAYRNVDREITRGRETGIPRNYADPQFVIRGATALIREANKRGDVPARNLHMIVSGCAIARNGAQQWARERARNGRSLESARDNLKFAWGQLKRASWLR